MAILLITGGNKLSLDIMAILENKAKVFIPKDLWEAEDIYEKHHIDFAFIITQELDEPIQRFISGYQRYHSTEKILVLASAELTTKMTEQIVKYPWFHSPYPPEPTAFLELINRVTRISQFFDDKTITLEKRGYQHTYKARNIKNIVRSKPHYITINTDDGSESEEFYFRESLTLFTTIHGIEAYLKQANQALLIRPTDVFQVKLSTYELIMKDKTTIKSSRKFIYNFSKRKRKDKTT